MNITTLVVILSAPMPKSSGGLEVKASDRYYNLSKVSACMCGYSRPCRVLNHLITEAFLNI